MDRWKSRKLWFSFFVVIVATIMLWIGRLNGDDWIEVMKWIGGAYLVSNAIVHHAYRTKG